LCHGAASATPKANAASKNHAFAGGDGAGLRATSAAPINYWVAAEAALAMVARRAWAKRFRPAGSARSSCARPRKWHPRGSPAAWVPQAQLSLRFEIYAVSTSIEGMSGDFNTTNPACLNLRLANLADVIERRQHSLRSRHAGTDVRRL